MEWILTFLIIVFATMIQTGTGFGFAIIAIPLLLLLHDAHYAIPLSNILSLTSALTLLPRTRKEIDKQQLRPLFIGSLLGLPLGGLVFYTIPIFWLKVAVSVTIILFTILLIMRVSLRLGSGKRVGFLAGFLASSVGMPGPPLVLYLSAKNTDKGAFRGTTIAFYSLMYPISLFVQAVTGHIPLQLLYYSLLMIPAIFIGQALGSMIHNKLNQNMFRWITYTLLLVSAINSLVSTL